MGITIHYRGQLDNARQVKAFIETAAGRCHDLGWTFERIRDIGPCVDGLVIFTADRCEPLSFLFSRTGVLLNVMDLAGKGSPAEPLPWVFVKTQFAGVDAHVGVISFLRWAKASYISNLEVEDEGKYWETNDAQMLRARMEGAQQMIRAVVQKSVALGSGVNPQARSEEVADMLIESLDRGAADRSDEALRKAYGDDAIISRVGKFNLIHLDHPTEKTIARRIRKFDPRKEFPDDCPLCQMMREQGSDVVFDGRD